MDIKLLSTDDLNHLYDFECRNRDWFERFVSPRSPGYFIFEDFKEIIRELLEEQSRGKIHMYVAYENSHIVARINLTNIEDGVADLGYRVCQSVVSKGVATESVARVLNISREAHGIRKINAKTSNVNKASQAVLKKNRFTQSHTDTETVEFNGECINYLYYEITV
ncbi:GNAT family N-acetyltransferase [Sansalvadorimonas sp. 2012CJ34-2]|uniref:GNAT family N-acetyltransferase n=1 Tax=Parendozoicomonas callyspongiae TaxID=2942213 RepID=A0ABT0PH02_9GAMM|nr:GNAT family protein [Sansalvadorimonas sp. 2012CJ34-2]MCL6270654.1 GNAT family N-acetyltransferase [Sansalvadorimonas sp. 2012CJ34-2]